MMDGSCKEVMEDRNGCHGNPASAKDDVKVIHKMPLFRQNYSWDCGLACSSMVLRFLGHTTHKVYTSDLEALQCGESIWTIDLAMLMRRYGVQHKLCTITLGVDKGYSKESFYSGKFSSDEMRISKLFEEAKTLKLDIEQRSVSRADILSHLQSGNVLIALVDWNHLECQWCNRGPCHMSCFSCVSSPCCGGYQGHYIVVCGYDKKKKRIFYKNPSYDVELCCTRMDKFDVARKSYGTDEDVLFVYKDGVS